MKSPFAIIQVLTSRNSNGENTMKSSKIYFSKGILLFSKVAFGTQKLALQVSKVTFGTQRLALQVGKVAFGTQRLALQVSKVTFGTQKLALQVGKVTFGTQKLALQVSKVTFGTQKLALQVGKVTFGTPKLALQVCKVTFGTPKQGSIIKMLHIFGLYGTISTEPFCIILCQTRTFETHCTYKSLHSPFDKKSSYPK